MKISIVMSLLFGFVALSMTACQKQDRSAGPGPEQADRKTAILLVSHGSHSENWRKMLLDVETDVRGEILENPNIHGMASAFMEYTEPSIATRLKEFDAQGFTNVVIVPILLTVSTHSFDDIPVIAGQREDISTLEQLKLDKTEVYHSKANIVITPLLDFPALLSRNVVRRIRRMSESPESEGVVLVAYGSEPFNDEWEDLINRIGKVVKKETGISKFSSSWCGHIVRYKTEPTRTAIESVLQQKKKALVLPLLIAVDETFQGKIIGGAIQETGHSDQVLYRHDSILPDKNVNQWIIDVSNDHAEQLSQDGDKQSDSSST